MKAYEEFVAKFDQTRFCATTHTLGLASEAGEVAQLTRKTRHLPNAFDAASNQMILELGDVLYYLTALAQDYGWSLEDVAAANMAKLRARHPDREAKP